MLFESLACYLLLSISCVSLLLHVLHTHKKKQVEFRSKKTYGRKKKEKLDVVDLDLTTNSNDNVRYPLKTT